MRSRRGQDPTRNPVLLLIGLSAVALAVVVLLVAMRAQDGLPGKSYYRLSVQFADAGGAPVLPPPGSDVRVAGRYVGQTREGRFERGVATLKLQLRDDAGPLPADTTFAVRAQGLLGAKYVDVHPGRSARTLPDGAVIAPRRSAMATSLSELLQTLDRRRRDDLGQFIRGLGGGLAGRGGQLNAGLEDLAAGLRRFSRAVRPVVADATLPGFVSAAELVAGAFDPVRGELAQTFAPAARAIAPFADERRSVERLLAEGPGSLDRTRAALAQTDPLLVRAERFAVQATRFTRNAPRALRATTRLLVAGRAPLRRATAVVRTARAAVPPTLRLTRALGPALPRLRASLLLARHPAATLGAYGCDISRFGTNWRSFLGYAPAGQVGHLGPLAILRATLPAGGLPGLPAPQGGVVVDGDIEPCEEPLPR